MKTKQEMFDIIVKGILKQGCQSIDGKSCKYRGPNTHKCAAGLLIPDEKYSSDLEGKIAMDFPVYNIIESEGYDPFFVQEFQTIHDAYGTSSVRDLNLSFIDYWKKKMIILATNNNLSYEVLK